jgi:isocitrate dehydrogenase kinase/phosphatase
MKRRRRFVDVIERQLELFEREHAQLIREAEAAEKAYDRAPREEAEERYGDYLDLVETGTEVLAELRDNYASSLGEDAADEYEESFNRAVLKRLPRFALEIEDT